MDRMKVASDDANNQSGWTIKFEMIENMRKSRYSYFTQRFPLTISCKDSIYVPAAFVPISRIHFQCPRIVAGKCVLGVWRKSATLKTDTHRTTRVICPFLSSWSFLQSITSLSDSIITCTIIHVPDWLTDYMLPLVQSNATMTCNLNPFLFSERSKLLSFLPSILYLHVDVPSN